jgi:hypothetical protein
VSAARHPPLGAMRHKTAWRLAQECLDGLKRQPGIQAFHRPVDEERDEAPGYYARIAKPVDLSIICSRLENAANPTLYPNKARYASPEELNKDVLLMLSNCKVGVARSARCRAPGSSTQARSSTEPPAQHAGPLAAAARAGAQQTALPRRSSTAPCTTCTASPAGWRSTGGRSGRRRAAMWPWRTRCSG